MKKIIIFDLDGTLLNSLKDLWAAVNGALWSVGLPYRSEEEVRQFVGDGVDMLIRRAIGDEQNKFDDCKAAFKKLYDKDMQNQTRPYDGVNKMLADLKAKGLEIAVLSNKYDSAVKTLCEYYFKDKISYAVGQKDGVKVKPDPAALKELLENAGYTSDEALYCGDGEADVLCAKAAGVDFIAAAWGFRHYSVLEKAGAKVFAGMPAKVFAGMPADVAAIVDTFM